MSKWCAIHSNAQVFSNTGFHWIRIPFDGWVPNHCDHPFVEMLNIKTDKELSPESAMRIYLSNTMSSTFCLGQESGGNGGTMFVVGVRSEKDLFQLILRFTDAIETKVRSYGTTFFVRVRKGDSFLQDDDPQPTTYEVL